MDVLQRIQPLDYMLLIVWGLAVGVGAGTGTIRQLFLLVGVYAAAIVAAQIYGAAGAAVAYAFGLATLPQGQVLGYVVLFFGTLALIGFFTWRAYPHTLLASSRRVDQIGGGLIAGVWGALALIAIVAMLRFFVTSPWPGQQDTQQAVEAQLRRSQLPVVLQAGLPPLWQAMLPWFPDRARAF